MRLSIWISLLVIVPGLTGCEKKRKTAMEQARSRPGNYMENMDRLADGTCKHTVAYTCIKDQPCDVPEPQTVKCPYTYFRFARTSKGTCILEPFMRCKSGTGCTVTPISKPCPEALTDTGFILRKEGLCELTLIKDGQRTTSQTPCPDDLPMPIE